MKWALLCLLVGLVSCDSASVELPAPDAGPPVTTDAAGPSWEITIFRTDGERAAGALVYELDSLQGSLLGRADEFGFFRHQGPFTEVLVRQAFNLARAVDIREPQQEVRLRLVRLQPELLRLKNVGLEQQLTYGDNDIDAVVGFNEELLALRQVSRTEVQLVRVDPETGHEEAIYEVAGSEAVTAEFFEVYPGSLAIRFSERASSEAPSRNWFVVYRGPDEPLSGPSVEWIGRGLDETQAVDTTGSYLWLAPGPSTVNPVLAVTTLSVTGATGGERFELPDSVACFGTPQEISSQALMRIGDAAWRFDAVTSTLTQASSFAVLGQDCRRTWVADGMLMSLDFEGNQVAVHGRQRVLIDATWTQLSPRSARLRTLVPIDEHRAFMTARPDDRGEYRLIYVDTERNLFVDFSTQLRFVSAEIESGPEVIDGRWAVRLVGGSSNYHRAASINDDGTDPRIDQLGLRLEDNPPCPPLLSRGVPVMPLRWGVCRDEIIDGRSSEQRTFFDVELANDGFDVAFVGDRIVYRAGENLLLDTELFTFDTNAPR